jgi:hypothetical protein
MNDLVILGIIVAVPATAGAVQAFYTHKKLEEVGLKLNGRLSELLEITKISSFAAGVTAEHDRNKDFDSGVE